MKMDRLIGILTILLQNEKMTAPALAERFEVSRRTINRDLENLCKAGIPIVTTQGYGGGIAIDSAYKIDKTLLTQPERAAIFAGLASIDSVSSTSYARKLAEKLFGVAEDTPDQNSHFLIDLASHYRESLTLKIDTIRRAIDIKNRIDFTYYYAKGTARKQIEPYFVVFQWNAWYVFGYCLARDAWRLYKLNRITELVCTDQRFAARSAPLQALAWNDYFADTAELVALFAPDQRYRLVEEYGAASFTEQTDGRLLLRVGFTNEDAILVWLLGFGGKAEVLAPPALRTRLCAEANEICRKYRSAQDT